MTETEWLAASEPGPMLDYLEVTASRRKLRKLQLFNCACCRFVWPFLTDERCRRAVEVAERHADGQASQIEVEVAMSEVRAASPSTHPSVGITVGSRPWRDMRVIQGVTRAAWSTLLGQRYGTYSARSTARETAAVASLRGRAWPTESRNWQCNLLRDIFGNPFQPTPAFDLTRPGTSTATSARLARAIYDRNDFDDLPILADALEDAGCEDGPLLTHCRSGGQHVRGCWAVDLLLGKQ